MFMTPHISRPLVLLALAVAVKSQSFFQGPLHSYHHEILYPGTIQGSINLNGNPVSLSAGFNLKPLQPLSLPRRLPPPAPLFFGGNFFRNTNSPSLFPVNLFTPNKIAQRPETSGQVENYNKALEEEAKELEKELNDITTQFGELQEEVDQPKSFVNVVQVKGDTKYDYGYST